MILTKKTFRSIFAMTPGSSTGTDHVKSKVFEICHRSSSDMFMGMSL